MKACLEIATRYNQNHCISIVAANVRENRLNKSDFISWFIFNKIWLWSQYIPVNSLIK